MSHLQLLSLCRLSGAAARPVALAAPAFAALLESTGSPSWTALSLKGHPPFRCRSARGT